MFKSILIHHSIPFICGKGQSVALIGQREELTLITSGLMAHFNPLHTALRSERKSERANLNKNLGVTITPYLSRDTTYCYRHCKGISRFPLLLHHSSPRPMPDRTTSTSLTFAYVTTPYRTHASNPHPVYCLTDSLVPLISLPHSPLDVTMTYDSDSDSNPYPFHDIIAYRSPTIRPFPLTLTIRTVIRYLLISLKEGPFTISPG